MLLGISFLDLSTWCSICILYLVWFSFYRFRIFSALFILKMYSIQLAWSTSLSSMPIIHRFGIFTVSQVLESLYGHFVVLFIVILDWINPPLYLSLSHDILTSPSVFSWSGHLLIFSLDFLNFHFHQLSLCVFFCTSTYSLYANLTHIHLFTSLHCLCSFRL